MVVGEWGGSIVGDPKAAANQQALARWLVKACVPDNFWWCVRVCVVAVGFGRGQHRTHPLCNHFFPPAHLQTHQSKSKPTDQPAHPGA